MNKEQLDKGLQDLEEKYNSECKELRKQYADANNPYKVGDVVEDNCTKIVIEKIGYYFSTFFIGCRYFGPELKKDGTPKKSGIKSWVYQNNIKS